MGVGGTTWGKVLKNIHGEKLTEFQAYLGNQWVPYKASPHKATFTVILLGSNDADQLQNTLNAVRAKNKGKLHRLQAKMEMDAAYAKATANIDKVIKFLQDELPGTTLLYSKILPRSWWDSHTRTYARWLDMYLLRNLRKSKKIHVREIWAREVFAGKFELMENVMHGMNKTDCIHLNYWGNTAMSYAIMHPLLHMWRAICRSNGSWDK